MSLLYVHKQRTLYHPYIGCIMEHDFEINGTFLQPFPTPTYPQETSLLQYVTLTSGRIKGGFRIFRGKAPRGTILYISLRQWQWIDFRSTASHDTPILTPLHLLYVIIKAEKKQKEQHYYSWWLRVPRFFPSFCIMATFIYYQQHSFSIHRRDWLWLICRLQWCGGFQTPTHQVILLHHHQSSNRV